MKAHVLTLAIAAISGLGLSACNNDNNDFFAVDTGDTVILTDNGVIATINKSAPDVLVSTRTVSGLNAGDQLVGIDYRPATGVLYALGNLGNLYTVDPSTGRATFATALSADAADSTNPFTGISSAERSGPFAVDFNPVADRLRVITNTGANLRINVVTGATTTDTAIASTAISAAAYTNSAAGTVSTELYDIDEAGDRIVLQNPPNDGTLSTAAPLGVNVNGGASFDIDAANNKGYALLKVNNSYGFYTIDLNALTTPTTNAATVSSPVLSNYFTTNGVRGLALKPNANSGATAVGLSAANQLIKFAPSSPNTVTTVNVTGLGAGETLVGIDYRLRTSTANAGVLYGLTRNSSNNVGKIYTINTTTGAATFVSTLSVALTDTSYAVDFNPVPDLLRVIGNSGTNLRVNVDGVPSAAAALNGIPGATVTDTPLTGVAGVVVTGAAYTNNFTSPAAPSATRLLDLDQTNNLLLLQDPPNNGTVSQVGTGGLGIALGSNVGYDIAGGYNGLSLAVAAGATGPSTLYRVNTTTGAAALAVSVANVPNAAASVIGTTTTPALIDIALLLK